MRVAISWSKLCAIVLISNTALSKVVDSKDRYNQLNAVLAEIDVANQQTNAMPADATQPTNIAGKQGVKVRSNFSNQRQEFKVAQKSIEEAEAELAKVKQSLQDLQPKNQETKRIIRLDQSGVQTFDRSVPAANQAAMSANTLPSNQMEPMPGMQMPGVPNGRSQTAAVLQQQMQGKMNHGHMDMAMGDKGHEGAFMHAHGWHASGLKMSDFKYMPFGFVKTEFWASTRQEIGFEQLLQLFLLPVQRINDALGNDVEAQPQFIFTGLHAHSGFLVEGPTILNGKPTADISAEYYGPLAINFFTESGISDQEAQNGFFFVHAALYFEWETLMILFGRAWHPGVDPEIAVSMERATFIGSLSEPLSRVVQARIQQKLGSIFQLILCGAGAVDQNARRNLGIEPNQSPNVAWFNFHVQGRAHVSDHIFALAADVYTERPRLFDQAYMVLDTQLDQLVDLELVQNDLFPSFTAFNGTNACLNTRACCSTNVTQASANQTANSSSSNEGVTSGFINPQNIFKSTAGVTSFSMMAFARLAFDPFIFKVKALVGSNLGQPLGGFAVIERAPEPDVPLPPNPPTNPTGSCPVPPLTCYGPLRLSMISLDFTYKKTIEPGLFIGATKNLGSRHKLFALPNQQGDNQYLIYRLAPNLDYTVTISPRIKYHLPPITFAGEIEFIRASYGNITPHATICNGVAVDNVRFIFSAYFNF